jgi:Coenzyme PQQ synthesis protein D (PqqD)
MRFKRNEEVLFVQSGDEVVMLDVETGLYHHLNETASAIWSALSQPRQIHEICELVQKDFQGEQGRVHTDVEAFVQNLVQRKLLLEVTPGRP